LLPLAGEDHAVEDIELARQILERSDFRCGPRIWFLRLPTDDQKLRFQAPVAKNAQRSNNVPDVLSRQHAADVPDDRHIRRQPQGVPSLALFNRAKALWIHSGGEQAHPARLRAVFADQLPFFGGALSYYPIAEMDDLSLDRYSLGGAGIVLPLVTALGNAGGVKGLHGRDS
jgi:hypothetical protein